MIRHHFTSAHILQSSTGVSQDTEDKFLEKLCGMLFFKFMTLLILSLDKFIKIQTFT